MKTYGQKVREVTKGTFQRKSKSNASPVTNRMIQLQQMYGNRATINMLTYHSNAIQRTIDDQESKDQTSDAETMNGAKTPDGKPSGAGGNDKQVQGHLINESLGGTGDSSHNLTPQTRGTNNGMSSVEAKAREGTDDNYSVTLETNVDEKTEQEN